MLNGRRDGGKPDEKSQNADAGERGSRPILEAFSADEVCFPLTPNMLCGTNPMPTFSSVGRVYLALYAVSKMRVSG